METLSPSRLTRSATSKKLPSPSKPSADQIATPEKPIQPPRWQRNRRVALSLKEVKRVATTARDPTSPLSSQNDLSSMEQEIVPNMAPMTKAAVKLIDRYGILAEFFNCMVSSIQLLRLRGSVPTFPNICACIQSLCERKFSYVHLSQLKYIYSEAIVISKVVVRDEATSCMRPELQVGLQIEAVEEDVRRKGETGYSALRRVFRERLVDFSNKHPQGDDVPEEMLPHPFNRTREIVPPEMEKVQKESLHIAVSHQQFAGPSHISRSFKPCFSQREIPCELKTSLLCLDQATSKDVHPISAVLVSTSFIGRKSPLGLPTALPSPSKLETPEKNTKVTMADKPSLEERTMGGTPIKCISTPLRLMTRTPDLQTPKRSRLDVDCDTPQPVYSEKRSTRTKLFRTPRKNEKTEDDQSELTCSSFDDYASDVELNFLPKKLLQSIQEKERKALEEKEAGVDEARQRRQLLSRLPNMFDTILLIVQSTQRSTMTKQEPIHKIIASNTKILDKVEAEEQLKLLQELVPDYIFEKLALSGEALCCVNKMSSPGDVRQRIAEAV